MHSAIMVDEDERGASSGNSREEYDSMTDCSCAPPAPVKFKKHAMQESTGSANCVQGNQEDSFQRYIEATRRHALLELCKTDMCPLNSTAEQADLWVALEDIFLQ